MTDPAGDSVGQFNFTVSGGPDSFSQAVVLTGASGPAGFAPGGLKAGTYTVSETLPNNGAWRRIRAGQQMER